MKSRFAITQRVLLLAVALPLGSAVVSVAAPPNRDVETSGKVCVTLRPPLRNTFDVLCIADVAELSGGSESLRRRIAILDIEDSPPAGESLKVTAQQIEFRLRLAGIDPRLVTIRGSTVSPAGTKTVTAASQSSKAQTAMVRTDPANRIA